MSSSPFDFLSTEVIQEIFFLCLAEDRQTSNENYVAQLVISQVSSIWRSIALNTPQLWDNFVLSVEGNRQRLESAFQLASLWFDRAGSLPITLNVRLGLPQHRLDYYIQDLHCLMASHQFKSLTGDLDLFSLPLHNKSYEASFTFLESLSLVIPKGFSVDSSQAGQSPDGDNYCQLPSLRYVDINFRCNVSWQAVLHMIPWHQLTKLTLDYIKKVSTVIKIMRECKALVECRLLIVRASHTNEDFVSPSTSLPHLRNLRLFSDLPISNLIKVLSTFNVPNLTSIYVKFTPTSQMNTDLLSSQIDTPLQQLQEFTFVDSFKLIDIRMFLRHMPSLRRLNLCGYVSLDHDIANEISTGQLGPHIDTLSFRSCVSFIDMGCVLDMIEKRQENAKSDKGRKLAPFVHVKFDCFKSGDNYKERVEHLERQYNVRIQTNYMLVYSDYYESEEEH